MLEEEEVFIDNSFPILFQRNRTKTSDSSISGERKVQKFVFMYVLCQANLCICFNLYLGNNGCQIYSPWKISCRSWVKHWTLLESWEKQAIQNESFRYSLEINILLNWESLDSGWVYLIKLIYYEFGVGTFRFVPTWKS